MIYKEKDLVQGNEKKKPRKIVNYDVTITIRVDTELLKEFKEIVGSPYQPRIRELMEEYVNRHKYTYAQEQERRNKMLGKKA